MTARRSAVVVLVVTVLAAVVWAQARRDLPWLLFDADSRQYADVARRLAHGEGFTTGIIYPLALRFGAGPEHPSLLVPPLWPLILAACFALTGEQPFAPHLAALLFHLAAVAAATALAIRLAGPAAGVVAGLAILLSPEILDYALFPMTESAFGFFVALVFLLAVQRWSPFWIGAACGLALLTRHNGLLLAPVALALLLRPPFSWRGGVSQAARFAAGWVLVLAPWWIRNGLVSGDPFFSFSDVYLRFALGSGREGSMLYYLDPRTSPQPGFAPDAWSKVGQTLPWLFPWWPPALMALPACLGLLLGAARRDRASLAVLALLAMTTLLLLFSVPNPRYFVPLLPTLLAVGTAAWWRFGGPLRVPALVLVLATRWIPMPIELAETAYLRAALERVRGDPAHVRGLEEASAALRHCVPRRALVLAMDATRIGWDADAIAIYSPVRQREFWQVLEEHPVAWVQIEPSHPWARSAAFRERFVQRSDCGDDLFERRPRAPPESGAESEPQA